MLVEASDEELLVKLMAVNGLDGGLWRCFLVVSGWSAWMCLPGGIGPCREPCTPFPLSSRSRVEADFVCDKDTDVCSVGGNWRPPWERMLAS